MLRSARRPARVSERQGRVSDEGDDWLTVREAAETTGVPTSTIRKWARHENIPSYLEKTEDGYLRIVSMSGIREWADKLGREVDGPVEQIDLSDDRRDDIAPDIPEGTMLVPLDAWNKMLNQLGNLHEAGQQLAEARERAAKAETEATFLRERLRDLRAEAEERARLGGEQSASPEGTPTQATKSLVRRIYSDWIRRRRQ